VQKTLGLLHTLYRHGLVRAYYAFEEKTYNIRNELGDYYLAEEPPALDEAIAQFLRVLAVDPGDLSATFRLGKVYLWKRDWKSALDSFQSVYRADQYYENVAAQYNQVSREHPNSIITLGSYFADTQRAQWHAEAVYLQRFNTVLGMSASYQTDVVRFQQWDPYTALTDHSSYQLHDISLGVPIDLFEANVTLTPWVGGMLRTNGLYNKTQSGGTVSPAFIEDQFEAFAAEPYVKLDSTLGVGSALFLNSTLRWGRQPDTFDPARKTAVYDASAELNVTTLLSFIDIWPLRDTSIRTYGRVDLLHTPEFSFTNLLYTGLLEISSNVVKGGSPYRVISVGGNVTYENSANVESYLYYAPNGVLLAGGTLAASVWFGVGGGDVMGVSARGYAGSYQELVLSASPIQRFKWEAEADVSLTQGNATYTLSAIANSTFRYDQAAWDYWSAYVRLGCSVKLPTLLVP
jgi:tetratricopeptide (TPR) repeat protein